MNYTHWQFDKDDDGIGWMVMNVEGSSVNILKRSVIEEMSALVSEIEADDSLTGLCFISGKPGGYVYGADINEFSILQTEAEVAELMDLAHGVFARLEMLSLPTATGINGIAVGGGLEIALPFGRIVAVDSPRTQLGFPEISLGIMPGYGGTGRAVRRIGVAHTLEMVLTGRMVRATEALEWGLVDALVGDEDMLRGALKDMLTLAAPEPVQETADDITAALSTAEDKYLSRARRYQDPTPFRILDHYKAVRCDAQKLTATERDSFPNMLLSETSIHLRRVFQMTDAVRKSARGDSKIQTVHVIGAGTMGGDIAAIAAMQGFDVTLTDRDGTAIDSALVRATALYDRRIKDDKKRIAAQARLTGDKAGSGVKIADIIIEAVAENLDIKKNVFAAVEADAKPDAILATNTSSIQIEDIAQGLTSPKRLIGLHFFNPVPVLPLVEVIAGTQSDETYLERAMYFSGQLKKMPVRCKSTKGFLVNRALLPYLFKGIAEMVAGTSADKIDEALVRFGMPMGPIELADQVGLDVCRDVGLVLGMPEAAATALEEKLAAGALGRKTGSGFYDWDGKKAVRPRASYDAQELEALAETLLAPMVEKCRTAVSEGIVANRDDADFGCIMGIGFPRFRGGPLGWADFPRR